MSQENVEIVRASIDALQQGEFETSLSYFSEDVVFHPLVAGPHHGRARVAKQMEVWMDEFNDYWFEGDELIDAGDKVVLSWRHGGEGRSSGIRVEAEGTTVFNLEDGPHLPRPGLRRPRKGSRSRRVAGLASSPAALCASRRFQ